MSIWFIMYPRYIYLTTSLKSPYDSKTSLTIASKTSLKDYHSQSRDRHDSVISPWCPIDLCFVFLSLPYVLRACLRASLFTIKQDKHRRRWVSSNSKKRARQQVSDRPAYPLTHYHYLRLLRYVQNWYCRVKRARLLQQLDLYRANRQAHDSPV